MVDVAVIGLGRMGSEIARRLLGSGHRVFGYNRRRERAGALADLGLIPVDSPRAAASAAAVLVTSLTDGKALTAVLHGPQGALGALRSGSLLVETSTTGPEIARSVGGQVRARGAEFLDAPISGSPAALREGSATFLVGGSPLALERARPVLQAIAPRVVHVGGPGSGALAKLAVNIGVAVQFLAFAEGVALGELAGVDRAVMVDALLQSSTASPSLKRRGPYVLSLPEAPTFTVEMMRRDLVLALRQAATVGLRLPATTAAAEVLSSLQASGMGGEEIASMFTALISMRSRPVRPARSAGWS